MLREAGQTVWLVDVLANSGRSGRDPSFPEDVATLVDPAPYPVNLFLMNPGDLARVIGVGPRAVRSWDRINICLPFWELAELPEESIAVLESFDVVLAGSRFNYECYVRQLSGPMVRYAPQPLYLDRAMPAQRTRWGLDLESFVFMTSFDMASDVNRKNPCAAIEAFRQAFPSNSGVALVIKVNNSHLEEAWKHHIEGLKRAAGGDSRVIIIDEAVPYAEVLSLYECCDAYVSLHRAEGLGLCLLEAMAMGKPVIATAWSGNMEFMTDQNSCLVGFSFVPVRGSTQEAYRGEHIPSGSRWADPDVGEAARWMRRLVENPELRRQIGARAVDAIAERRAKISADALLGTVRAYCSLNAGPGMDSTLQSLG
jgi:glycosyltransferase involved in cell wall biosynthesis